MPQFLPTLQKFAAPCACQNASRDSHGQATPCPRRLAFAKAARELIVEKGLEGLRTRDVAARAGINIATLHYHVPTKEALIHIVADSVRAEFIAQDEAHPRDGMTPRQQLRQEIDDFAELIAERQDLLTVMAEFSERERRDASVYAIFSDMRAHWHNTISQILKKGIKDGSFRQNIDPTEGANIFISALIAAGKRADLSGKDLTMYFNQLERLYVPDQSPNSGP